MDKILSIQTIKNVFAALGAKTSDSNYGVALLDKTTAEPKGLMGMSDLASVLGGVTISIPNTDDLNDKKTTGLYAIVPTQSTWESLHYPSKDWGVLRVTQSTAGLAGVIQEVYGYAGTKYQRGFYNNNWDSWSRMDNFGCNTAADLASLLGGIEPFYIFRDDFTIPSNDTVSMTGTVMGGLLILRNNSSGKVGTAVFPYNIAFSSLEVITGISISRSTTGGPLIISNTTGSSVNIACKVILP